jgi:thiol:disulfide interchange protein DsbD
VLLGGLGLALGPAAAALAAQEPAASGSELVRARLVARHEALRPGETTLLGVALDIEPGWHLYAAARNDSGYPIVVEPRLPPGHLAGALLWPAPRRHLAPGGLLDHVYEGELTLLLPVTVPEDAEPGTTLRYAAHLDWLVCREACLLGSADVSLSLRVEETTAEHRRTSGAARIERAEARLPRPAAEAPFTAQLEADSLVIRAPGAARLAFYPDEGCADFADLVAHGEVAGEELRLMLDRRGQDDAGVDTRIAGVVELHAADGTRSSVYRLDLPGAGTDRSPMHQPKAR